MTKEKPTTPVSNEAIRRGYRALQARLTWHRQRNRPAPASRQTQEATAEKVGRLLSRFPNVEPEDLVDALGQRMLDRGGIFYVEQLHSVVAENLLRELAGAVRPAGAVVDLGLADDLRRELLDEMATVGRTAEARGLLDPTTGSLRLENPEVETLLNIETLPIRAVLRCLLYPSVRILARWAYPARLELIRQPSLAGVLESIGFPNENIRRLRA